jgi:hypothetical protein
MTAYAGDASIPAGVGNGRRIRVSQRPHQTVGTQQGLHPFPARIGPRRAWFQPARSAGGKPSPFWHHGLIASNRTPAIRPGAHATSPRDLPATCQARETASDPQATPHGRPPGLPATDLSMCPGCRRRSTLPAAQHVRPAQALQPSQQRRARRRTTATCHTTSPCVHMCVLSHHRQRQAEAGS